MSNIEPGSWERDELGRKFRRVGNSIEYAPTITTTYGEFEVGHVPPPPKIVEEKRPKTWGDCPFRSKCTTQCARYTESGCGIVTGAPPVTGQRKQQHSTWKHALKNCGTLWKT